MKINIVKKSQINNDKNLNLIINKDFYPSQECLMYKCAHRKPYRYADFCPSCKKLYKKEYIKFRNN